MPDSPSHYFSRQTLTAPKNPPQTKPVRFAGSTLHMATGAGVFAKGGLDAGSRLLLKWVLPASGVLQADAKICDLGCGWGALGCFIAARHGSTPVVMCDINARAAWLANWNALQNELENARAFCGDGLGAIANKTFEMVVCNPPIRAGNIVMGNLFSDAHRCLKKGGALWLVIRTSQGAKSWQKRLENLFGNCETIVIQSGYRILKCEKR